MKLLRILPLAAHLLSWAAFFGVVFWPYGYSSVSETLSPDGEIWAIVFGEHAGPFRRHLGLGEISLLLIPTVLTALAVWLVWWRGVSVGTCQASNVGAGVPMPWLLFCTNLVRKGSRDQFYWGVLLALGSGIGCLGDVCHHDQSSPGRRIETTILRELTLLRK